MKKALLLGIFCVVFSTGLVGSAYAAAPPPVTILLTHPRPEVLHFYITLVREHLLDISGLKFVGVYHAAETEDYNESAAFLRKENVNFISLRAITCPIGVDDVFKENACRDQFRDLAEHASGIIFNGGPDIPPALYQRPTELLTSIVTPHRHYFEVSLLANLLGSARNRKILPLLANRPDFAILAICVGMQTLNVADGGTLIQDIPSRVYGATTVEDLQHGDPNTWHRSLANALDPEPGVAAGVFHGIILTAQAPQALRIVAQRPQVLSIHHQAVDRLGADYTVTATSLDGKIVEGIRHKVFTNVVGWQFHPERSPLWVKQEQQRRFDGAPETNFAFDTLQKDAASRNFNATIWQVFSQAVLQSAQHEIQSTH